MQQPMLYYCYLVPVPCECVYYASGPPYGYYDPMGIIPPHSPPVVGEANPAASFPAGRAGGRDLRAEPLRGEQTETGMQVGGEKTETPHAAPGSSVQLSAAGCRPGPRKLQNQKAGRAEPAGGGVPASQQDDVGAKSLPGAVRDGAGTGNFGACSCPCWQGIMDRIFQQGFLSRRSSSQGRRNNA